MRQPVTFFVSYARADKPLADAFLQCLVPQLLTSKHYSYTLWRDTDILVGEPWREDIRQALEACHLGLLLVSPAFLASPFITQEELPRFVGQGARPVLPVLLQRVDWQRHDLRGLQDHQIFQLHPAQSFAHCTTAARRSRFVETLFAQIEQRLDRLFQSSESHAVAGGV